MNLVTLRGNIGQEPEYHTSGINRCHISLATNEKWQDNNGETKESVEWHNIVFWNKQADIANEKLRKGDYVLIEGKLVTNKHLNKENVMVYTTQIHAKKFILLASNRTDDFPTSPVSKNEVDSDLVVFKYRKL